MDSVTRKILQGDREAFGELWDAITPKLFGYLINTLRDRPLAEDVFQTTWIKAVEGIPKLRRHNTNIQAWIFTIARNECRMHWRKVSRETPLDPTLHDKAENDKKEMDDRALVERLLSSLSESDREILRLRYIAEFSTQDVARTLNINFVTARVRIHRALQRANNILQTNK